MLVTQQAVFRKHWHAVMPLSHLADGPKPFRLLGVDIVLFLDEQGQPAALRAAPNRDTGWIHAPVLNQEIHGPNTVHIRSLIEVAGFVIEAADPKVLRLPLDCVLAIPMPAGIE
mgnify:CR=1 FL=1